MSLTSAQEQAVAARGNVVVVAGAGTGKTKTLVERCLHCLTVERPQLWLDEVLMVTFTDAAAAEMRQRIRERLEHERERNPGELRWQEQLALFETAHTGKLHSFCFQLVRQHFYELELDPQLAVMPEEEARLLAEEKLEEMLQGHYAGRSISAAAVQELIQKQGMGRDRPIRTLVRRLHHYTQTRPDPASWFRHQLGWFAAPQPVDWQAWLHRGLTEWRAEWLPLLHELSPGNDVAADCAAILGRLSPKATRAEFATALQEVRATIKNCPFGQTKAWVRPLREFPDEADFLASLANLAAGKNLPEPADPLEADWGWVRHQMSTLLGLAQEFNHAFSEAKRELGMVDFHDLEQYTLRLLWTNETNQPTKIAEQWRKKLRFVFVDEYQDINAAQDKIIQALSREGADANRFLVGDVKQSIYRFRQAEPKIFQGYMGAWRGRGGQAIPLVENFRSREGVLLFINSLFSRLMRGGAGGLSYDEEAQLRFGAPQERGPLSAKADQGSRVELHLRFTGERKHEAEAGEALAQAGELEDAAKEARLLALRLSELKAQPLMIWDDAQRGFRPVEWGDMAILLRAPANKADRYAQEFSRLNVPLLAERGGFYESTEISDLLSLFQVLDNPLQDVPALAVLRSPLVGLTLNELATIRLSNRKAPYWRALEQWSQAQARLDPRAGKQGVGDGPSDGPAANRETARKVEVFLERFARWRQLVRQMSLSRCLEAVLAETHYADWLLTQPRGEQLYANVHRLAELARQFDQFKRQGLFRFLHFIEAQQLAETEPEVAPVSQSNSVRLLSIHQSKGLEFPVVAVADLGKRFNESDLRSELILDEEYGLCPQISPPHTAKRYPSLPYWLARRRQMQELLGEELRLLYVAMTRARDTLLLSASVSEARFNKVWNGEEEGPAGLSRPHSYADWLGTWFAQAGDTVQPGEQRQGERSFLRWMIHDDTRLLEPGAPAPAEAGQAEGVSDPTQWESLRRRLSWAYSFGAATQQPAKTSVSTLGREAAEVSDGEAVGFVVHGRRQARGPKLQRREPEPELFSRSSAGGQGPITPAQPVSMAASLPPQPNSGSRPSAAEVGSAHHVFLQLVSLARVGNIQELREEARRLNREKVLTEDEVACLNFEGLAAFWKSELGRQVRAQDQFIERELDFTARFLPAELAAVAGQSLKPGLGNEFIVVQGRVDLAVVAPRKILLVDFKTDAVAPEELSERTKLYEPQVKLYARALSHIYQQPDTECWLYFLACQRAVRVEG